MDGLSEKLREYSVSGALPMHMPGHKRNAARFPYLVGAELDITEIAGFDDLNDPRDLFADLGRRMERVWGAVRSFPLVNGSTVGILSAMLAALRDGGSAIIARGCHKSVYNGAILSRAPLRFIVPEYDRHGIALSIRPADVEAALDASPDARLVVITSPTYEGVISDIAGIADICHRRGALLLVDAAHGAHLGFAGFPASAVTQGADMVVQSLHKTLASPTQTAALHLNSGVGAAELARTVAMLQSSSPSYLLSSGIDGCVRSMEREGDALCRSWLDALKLVDDASRELRRVRILFRGGAAGVFGYDPSKIVVTAAGLTGTELMRRLRDGYGIELEMASGSYAVAMTGVGDTKASVGRFIDALYDMEKLLPDVGEEPYFPAPPLPEREIELAEALKLPKTDASISGAAGRVAGEFVWTYPPGSPILVPGEVVGADTLDYLERLSKTGVAVRSETGAFENGLLRVLDHPSSAATSAP